MAMVTPAEAVPGTEMTSISFRDQLWLSAYPLDRNLVFDYFALSPFYDRTCNNEQLRMESIHPLDMNHLSYATCSLALHAFTVLSTAAGVYGLVGASVR